MGLARWIAGTFVALVAAIFAVFNLDPVTISWSPFHAPLALPVSIFGLAAFALGLLCGGFVGWIGGGSGRRERRRQRKRIRELETALDAANENAQDLRRGEEGPKSPVPPLLLPKA